MSTTTPWECHSGTTWFPCSHTSTTKETTAESTTTSPTSTATTQSRTTTTTTTSPASTKLDGTDGLPNNTSTPLEESSTPLKKTSTASPNQESSATNSIPASSQTTLPIVPHAALSTGATAGIAVGCAAAGLVIGLLVALLLFRRRKGKGAEGMSHAAILVESKEPPSTGNIDIVGSGAGIQLGKFLLDGAPDQEIVSELQSLGELIRQHVEDYYSVQPVDANGRTLSQSLENLGVGLNGSRLNTEAIASLCANSYSRHLGLRCVISSVIFASIDFHSRSGLSMLPAPVAGLLQSIPGAEYGGSNPLAFSQALQAWRRLSAFLLHQNRSQRTSLQVDTYMIASQAQALASSLNNFLGPFVDRGKSSQQSSHLQEVVIECAKLGYVLFSHPVDWRFIFGEIPNGTADVRTVIVCPGLEKCSDRDGNPIRPPIKVAAQVEAAV
ncbi:hypothetical protein V8C42DRAFT_336041 [Trichoderma barbatum]